MGRVEPGIKELLDTVRKRYTDLHGREPPEGFLSQYSFFFDFMGMTPGSIYYRRLENLGEPRIKKHLKASSGELNKKGYVLDAGCGTGDDSRWLKENGYKVIGIDTERRHIKLGHSFYEDDSCYDSPVFLIGDVCSMPFGDESFANVYAGSLIHTIRPITGTRNFLGEVRRVLEKDGVFFGSTLGTDRDVSRFVPVQFRQEELKELIEDFFILDHFHALYQKGGSPVFRAYFSAIKE
jgi:SAM-dependent methyltransferase